MSFLKDIKPISEIMKDCPKGKYEEVRNTVNVLLAVTWLAGFMVAFIISAILL